MISFFLKNKRFAFILLANCLFNVVASAQWFLKPKMGLNYTHTSQPTSFDPRYHDNKIGFQFGTGAEYKFSNRMKVEADLIYSRKGFKETQHPVSVPKYTNSSHFDYLELPLVAKVPLNSQFSIGGGAYAAYLVHAVHKYLAGITTTNTPVFNKLPQEGFKKTDLGFVLDFSFVTGNFEIETRYSHGFKDVVFTMPDDPEYAGPSKLEFGKNRALQLTVAYRLEQW